jgi:hypothetical protein
MFHAISFGSVETGSGSGSILGGSGSPWGATTIGSGSGTGGRGHETSVVLCILNRESLRLSPDAIALVEGGSRRVHGLRVHEVLDAINAHLEDRLAVVIPLGVARLPEGIIRRRGGQAEHPHHAAQLPGMAGCSRHWPCGAGFSAVLVLPGMGDSNLALLTMVRKTFPAWLLGVVGGAGALTAMVPAAIQLLTGATMFAKNLCRPILAPAMTDRQVGQLARIMVLVLTLGRSAPCHPQLSNLGVASSAGVRRGSAALPWSCARTLFKTCDHVVRFCGAGHGISIAVALILTGRDPYHGLNAGFIALCFNFAMTGLVSLITTVPVGELNETLPAVAPSQTAEGASLT